MGQKQLSGLLVMSIENKTAKDVNLEETIKSFSEIKARKVEF
jgi:hypothetical protein